LDSEILEVPKGMFRGLVEGFLSENCRLWLVVEGMTEKKIFSCKDCGKPFDAYPPDDAHVNASLEQTQNAIPRTYKCAENHENTIYWTKFEPKLFTSRSR
jgi:hypothetical protein